jgi:hypothetical protein
MLEPPWSVNTYQNDGQMITDRSGDRQPGKQIVQAGYKAGRTYSDKNNVRARGNGGSRAKSIR